MPRKKNIEVPVLKVRKGATLREIYKRAHEEFSAADLQQFTEVDDTVPYEQALTRLEEIHRQELAKVKRKNHGRP